MTICVACGKDFLRMPATAYRTLKDGSVIDPNLICMSCEHEWAKQAIEAAPVAHAIASHTSSELRRMDRECLRKEAFFDIRLAMRIARDHRRRNRGKNPVSYYRCSVVIDPILHPERARKHWHLGGDRSRKN